MIRALIVDDEPLARARIQDLLADAPGIEVVGECGDGGEAVATILELRPDLVFLDVQMPELDGFDVLRAVADEHMPAVVFITAYDDFALDAFDVHAIDYVLKPIDPERFALAVERATVAHGRVALEGLVEHVADRRPERLVARLGRRFVRLAEDEIEWCEAAGNYVRLGTDRGECLMRTTMKALEARLAAERFVRIHRSVIVAAERVHAVTPRGNGQFEVELRGGRTFESSRFFGAAVRRLTAR